MTRKAVKGKNAGQKKKLVSSRGFAGDPVGPSTVSTGPRFSPSKKQRKCAAFRAKTNTLQRQLKVLLAQR